MDEYTKKVVDNIYAICKYNSIMLGDVERNAGVAPGYMSRLKHTDKSLTFKIAADMAKFINHQTYKYHQHYSLIELMTNDYDVELYNNTIRDQIEALKAKQEELEKLLIKE